MAYVVLARWWAKAGREDRVADVLAELSRASNAERGCRRYVPHRATEDPRAFFIYEDYDDETAFERHIASEHFRRLVEREAIPELLSKRDRTFFTPLGGA